MSRPEPNWGGMATWGQSVAAARPLLVFALQLQLCRLKPMVGTTLDDPVGPDHKPDLKASLHEIDEYLARERAYDLFEHLLRELVTHQPQDPLQHMLECLRSPHTSCSGPVNVIVSGTPCSGRSSLAQRLASRFGLAYICAGELLRVRSGVDTAEIGLADDEEVTELVLERIEDAVTKHKGWLLDGFPRTRYQTSRLQEVGAVPSHVLVVEATSEQVFARQRGIEEGGVEGEHIGPDALNEKLALYACHTPLALEIFEDRTNVIGPCFDGDDALGLMERYVRIQPRSQGPALPPRVAILGHMGTFYQEHGSRLAVRLGCALIDGGGLSKSVSPASEGADLGSMRAVTSLEIPNAEGQARTDALGVVGVRLRQKDCARHGWVLCGFPNTTEAAVALADNAHLAPLRIVALKALAPTSVAAVCPPRAAGARSPTPGEEERQIMLETQVMSDHAQFHGRIDDILQSLGGLASLGGPCIVLDANRPAEAVYDDIVEFVERPLPMVDR